MSKEASAFSPPNSSVSSTGSVRLLAIPCASTRQFHPGTCHFDAERRAVGGNALAGLVMQVIVK
jgi:hypothetical protein